MYLSGQIFAAAHLFTFELHVSKQYCFSSGSLGSSELMSSGKSVWGSLYLWFSGSLLLFLFLESRPLTFETFFGVGVTNVEPTARTFRTGAKTDLSSVFLLYLGTILCWI